MKKLLIIILALAFVLGMLQLAFGSGYNRPLWSTGAPAPSPFTPHGGYADTTNKCKDCHAVHLALGSYKILQGASSGVSACDYCHGTWSGAVSSVKGITLNTSGHGPNVIVGDNTIIYAPDDATPGYSVTFKNWGCNECHAVHNNNTIGALTQAVNANYAGGQARLLKAAPDPYGPTFAAGSTVELTRWCSACHNANIGTFGSSTTVTYPGGTTLAYGHDAGTTGITRYAPNGTYAYVRNNVPGDSSYAPRCNNCHAAGNIVNPSAAYSGSGVPSGGYVTGQSGRVGTGSSSSQPVNFPHSGYYETYQYALLPSQAVGERLDGVCNNCHYTPSLP